MDLSLKEDRKHFSRFGPRLRRALGPLGLLLLSGTASGQETDRSRLWTFAVQAVGQLVDGDLVGAVDSVAAARQVQALPELDALVGLAALAGGRTVQAAEQFRRAIVRGSTEPLVFYFAARAALGLGRRREALALIEQGLAVGGDRPPLRMAYALLLASEGRAKEARASLRQVARALPNLLDPELFPTPAEGAVALLGVLLRGFSGPGQVARTQAHLLWRAGRAHAACDRFDRLLVGAPSDGELLRMAAQCRLVLGPLAEALPTVEKALRTDPGSAQALATRGDILLALGRAAEAVTDLKRAADELPRDAQVLLALATACQESEQADCASRFFRYALVRSARLARAHLGLALHLQQAGQLEAARQAFDAAIRLEPGDPAIYRAAAQLAHQQGRSREAQRLLAAAGRAKRVADAMERRAARAQAQIQGMRTLLRSLATDATCGGAACRQALTLLDDGPRRFARAHLALAASRGAEADTLLAPLPGRMSLGPLIEDSTLLKAEGRTREGISYTLQRSLPMTIPQKLFSR